MARSCCGIDVKQWHCHQLKGAIRPTPRARRNHGQWAPSQSPSFVVIIPTRYDMCSFYSKNAPPSESHRQESPPIGGAVRNATSLIPQRLSYIILAITCSENVYAWPCIDSHGRVDRDNNTTPAIYAMHIWRESHNQPSTQRVNDGRSTWSPIFRGQGAKIEYLLGYITENEALDSQVPNL